jgi:hypothetical protein
MMMQAGRALMARLWSEAMKVAWTSIWNCESGRPEWTNLFILVCVGRFLFVPPLVVVSHCIAINLALAR